MTRRDWQFEIRVLPATMVGTPAFMAPEHALGLTTQIDSRSDQFARGAITYLILTGRAPFVGNDAASVLHEVVHVQPPRLSHFLCSDFSQIQAVLDRALAKQPRDRFDTIAAFALALASAAAPLIRAAAAPPAARIRTLRRLPLVHSVVPRDEDEAPPPIRRSAGRPSVVAAKTLLISHRRRRAAVLGVAALGLAAVIAHETWPRPQARIHEPTAIVTGAGSLPPAQRSRELAP